MQQEQGMMQQQEVQQQEMMQQQQDEVQQQQQQEVDQEVLAAPEVQGLQAGASFAGELLKWLTCCAQVHAAL
jgi:hypothetical protein